MDPVYTILYDFLTAEDRCGEHGACITNMANVFFYLNVFSVPVVLKCTSYLQRLRFCEVTT
jgi:hypothetical protein